MLVNTELAQHLHEHLTFTTSIAKLENKIKQKKKPVLPPKSEALTIFELGKRTVPVPLNVSRAAMGRSAVNGKYVKDRRTVLCLRMPFGALSTRLTTVTATEKNLKTRNDEQADVHVSTSLSSDEAPKQPT